jgi:hypothetical protein
MNNSIERLKQYQNDINDWLTWLRKHNLTFRGVKPSSLISVIVLFLGVKTTGVDVLGVFSTEGDVLGMLSIILEQSAEVSSSSSDVTSTRNTELLVVKLPKLVTKKRTRTRVNHLMPNIVIILYFMIISPLTKFFNTCFPFNPFDLQAIPNSSVITFANRSFSLIFLGTFRGVNTKHRRTIADLSGKNEQLNRKIKTVSKRYQRLVNMVKKTQPNESIPSTSPSVENTPASFGSLTTNSSVFIVDVTSDDDDETSVLCSKIISHCFRFILIL